MLSLAVAVVAVSWAAILIRIADAPVLSVAFWRLALASLLLLLPVLVRRQLRLSLPTRWSLAAGFLLAVHFAAWMASLFLTSVASSVMLVSTQPIFAALLAGPFLGEVPPGRTWLAISVTTLGAVIIAAGDLEVSLAGLAGDGLALLAAAAAAAYLAVGRRRRAAGPLLPYLLQVNGVAALVLGAWCLATGAPLVGFAPQTWVIFLALAVGPHLAGHGLLNLAVRQLPAVTVNVSLVGEPILSTAYAAALLAERPGMRFYPGALLIIGGLLVEFLGRRRVSRP